MTSNDNTPSADSDLIQIQSSESTVIFSVTAKGDVWWKKDGELVKAEVDSDLALAFARSIVDHTLLSQKLQEANTKLTMYEARYVTDSNYITLLETKVGIANANQQNDQHTIEQLEKKLAYIKETISVWAGGETDAYQNPDAAIGQFEAIIDDINDIFSQLQQ